MPKFAMLALCLALVAATAAFGGAFRPGAWYALLAKPSWTPPGWVFPIAWTILYILIAFAGWIAWRAEGFGRAMTVWLAGLAANGLWSYLFFGRQAIGLALIDILVLLALIVAFIATTWNRARTAALLFLPYLAWVSFATTLNASIWMMNR